MQDTLRRMRSVVASETHDRIICLLIMLYHWNRSFGAANENTKDEKGDLDEEKGDSVEGG